MKKFTLAVMMVAGLIGTQAAFAGDSGFYIFGAVGQTIHNDDKSTLDNALTSTGATGFSSNLNKPTVYSLDVGYQVNKNLAFEGGYIGSNNETYIASGGNLAGPLSASADASGWNAKVVGILPVADQFSLLGKIGVADIKESATVTVPGVVASLSGSKTDVTYGLGMKYDFTDSVSGRMDWDRYSVGSSSNSSQTSVWTVGVAYKF